MQIHAPPRGPDRPRRADSRSRKPQQSPGALRPRILRQHPHSHARTRSSACAPPLRIAPNSSRAPGPERRGAPITPIYIPQDNPRERRLVEESVVRVRISNRATPNSGMLRQIVGGGARYQHAPLPRLKAKTRDYRRHGAMPIASHLITIRSLQASNAAPRDMRTPVNEPKGRLVPLISIHQSEPQMRGVSELPSIIASITVQAYVVLYPAMSIDNRNQRSSNRAAHTHKPAVRDP
ncbi:hypothetical protein HYPSUDRAFT_205666 [Hypholoma sublateritium FD-334 SS-4]|uniref:Uncharacterized protein n=1 Tax=Hypholoma sublateritium (strain FD-334 SS-4) TaxID=945553 RepID=A0A0D2KTU5_HYPSF|nr:hypothetical protein HYPSUDRAFT_205666 [Hypholoma sublateritium FD-334 SS-4]